MEAIKIDHEKKEVLQALNKIPNRERWEVIENILLACKEKAMEIINEKLKEIHSRRSLLAKAVHRSRRKGFKLTLPNGLPATLYSPESVIVRKQVMLLLEWLYPDYERKVYYYNKKGKLANRYVLEVKKSRYLKDRYILKVNFPDSEVYVVFVGRIGRLLEGLQDDLKFLAPFKEAIIFNNQLYPSGTNQGELLWRAIVTKTSPAIMAILNTPGGNS